MNKAKRSLFNFLLGVMTCVLLIGVSTAPSLSNQASTVPNSPESHSSVYADLQAAEAVVVAQGMADKPMQRFTAVLTSSNIVPKAPATNARGAAGAILVGDRLVVRGDYGNLSSALRDYATDPLNPPNPNITSGIHLHRGEANQNGPFQYALTVTPDQTGLAGRFAGEYTLTGEQLQALSEGKLYVDLHTKKNRAGELRGYFRPL